MQRAVTARRARLGAAFAALALIVHARGALVDGDDRLEQLSQPLGQMRVGDLIPGAPTFRCGDDQPAAPQARQMIRDVRAGQLEISCQLSRVAGSVQQCEEDPGTGRVGHRPTQPVHHIEARSKSQHRLTIHSPLY